MRIIIFVLPRGIQTFLENTRHHSYQAGTRNGKTPDGRGFHLVEYDGCHLDRVRRQPQPILGYDTFKVQLNSADIHALQSMMQRT